MTQQQEKLSAFLDGEGHDSDVINGLTSDAELADKWKRYHLIRDCMRNEMTSDLNFDISAQVASKLEGELPMVAPKPSWKELPVVASVIPLVKQSGQLAVAACVTAVMIFSYQSYNQPEESQPFLTAPTNGPLGGLAPVSLSSSNGVNRDDMARLLEQQRQINALIEDHQRQIRLKNAGNAESNQVKTTEGDELSEQTPPQK
ncbi:sigma-E factor negative regulatory protein [Brumicola blandensis]|jgi:sigma-E factor negative regulatory protein RseA|uniref:Anti-sigma-E factor RseA n=1 Tax=Brumicola blandensis TaxID=3075611 RepID=A0AAW8R3D8_9ALTE|nr:RseA family anti-sigma factor [Alteromonas sp. W409]MDT0583938.1 RseA family anti-sigma factor [Alteromonas sp. W409]